MSVENIQISWDYQDITESIKQINDAIAEVVHSVTESVDGANVLHGYSEHVGKIIKEQTLRQKRVSYCNKLFGRNC